ncbi:MAG: DUF2259 domain-containing protein, partial [Treponema sp.]|nr:DUF2259 domain-containing protein [Treponema sp.]
MKHKRTFLTISLYFLTISCLWAGDSANFIDLGFSSDGRYYMFAQYGVIAETLKPWTEMIVVDVEKNNYAPNGRVFYAHNQPINAGQEGSGLLYKAIAENSGLANRYKINFPSQGQPLYIAAAGDPAFDGKAIQFRDFAAGNAYEAYLSETIYGSNENGSSSFIIQLDIQYNNGRSKKVTVGTPQIKRPLVFSNRICKVLVSPDGNSMIFVIEMKR